MIPGSAAESPTAPEQQALIERLRQQLSQTQRLAAIGELTSTTTHEFNNLLMTIINYAKLGLRHKDDASRDKALGKILDAANRASKVTQTILGLARNRTGNREPTDLAAIVSDTLVLLEKELIRYRILVEKELESTPPAIAEGNQIQRVLINLLTNARQAIGESGSIKIRLTYDQEAHQVVLMVRDSGKGIPPDLLPKIFEPFFSTKAGPDASGKGGTGLGLSACREIIEEHQGKIRVESSLGKGTAFHIRLPADPAYSKRRSA
jgi:signal transduction histidine kinase